MFRFNFIVFIIVVFCTDLTFLERGRGRIFILESWQLRSLVRSDPPMNFGIATDLINYIFMIVYFLDHQIIKTK